MMHSLKIAASNGHWTVLPVLAISFFLAYGCSRDARLAGRSLRSAVVKSVTLYGLTLDQSATPEQTAFAALQAIRDDWQATTPQGREAAMDKQYDLCAANEIQRRNHSRLQRDEFIYHIVSRWTPTVSHYVHSFPKTWEQAQPRFVRRWTKAIEGQAGGAQECELAMEVADPSGKPNAQAVMLVWLAQDEGYWRVLHFGFDHKIRSIGASKGDGSTLD